MEGLVMLAKCCNPACAHPFRYLSDGKLFRLEDETTVRPSTFTREYFWLCPSCSTTMTLRISNDGRVITVPMSEAVHLDCDAADRKKRLLLKDVSLFRRKEMAMVRGTRADKRIARTEE
jgi:hypothetical protein